MNVDGVRQKVATRFAQTLDSQDLGKKLEIVLWNHTLRFCVEKKYPLEWSAAMGTDSLRELYTQRAINLDIYNLKPNLELKQKLQSGELGLKKFIGMKPWEMNPEMWNPIFERVAFKALRKQTTVDVENAPDGAFQCSACKSMKTTYYQLQTRSADVKFSPISYPEFTHSLFLFGASTMFFFVFCRAHDLFYSVRLLWQTVETIELKETCEIQRQKMGYQIYVVEKSLPDGPCDPLEDVRPHSTHGISGKTLDSVPGVCAYSVDGDNAMSTAGHVRAWVTDIQKCVDWICEKMAGHSTITLENEIIQASSPDGTVAGYRVSQITEHCRECEDWSSDMWTPEMACWDLESEISGLLMIAEWLEKNAGKKFVHSY